jgi:hypothetical protein
MIRILPPRSVTTADHIFPFISPSTSDLGSPSVRAGTSTKRGSSQRDGRKVDAVLGEVRSALGFVVLELHTFRPSTV